MQYPIIDNLIYAYLRNGWTGLDVTESKNIFDENAFLLVPNIEIIDDYYAATRSDFFTVFRQTSGGFPVVKEYEPNTQYTISLIGYTDGTSEARLRILYTDNTFSSVSILGGQPESRYILTSDPQKSVQMFYYDFGSGGSQLMYVKNMMIEEGTEATPYEPYYVPDTDIANRLKLPLPHYFPHAVIDALQRAAAGTQTADDTEVLRHYLTPLGIGGI